MLYQPDDNVKNKIHIAEQEVLSTDWTSAFWRREIEQCEKQVRIPREREIANMRDWREAFPRTGKSVFQPRVHFGEQQPRSLYKKSA